MSDARETENCSLTDITHISEKISMTLLAVNKGKISHSQHTLDQIEQQQSKTKNNLKKTNRKELATKTILRFTP